MYSRSSEPVRFERDCQAVLVPQGEAVTLPAGSIGYIELGQEHARPVGFGFSGE